MKAIARRNCGSMRRSRYRRTRHAVDRSLLFRLENRPPQSGPYLATVLTIILIGFGLLRATAETPRDYYAEPGLNPFKQGMGQDFSEDIDPFGGTVRLHYTDLFIPGNGGLNISVQRVYHSLQDLVEYGERTIELSSPMGLGWTMHFGRIVRAPSGICTGGDPSTT